MPTFPINKMRYIFILFVLLFIHSINIQGQVTTVTISTAGIGAWTAPCGVTNATIICIGGGGGAGGGNGTNKDAGGGGGGGGCAIYNTIAVAGGTSYNYTVGAGGNGGTQGNNGTTGGFSQMIISATTIKGFGGVGGNRAPNGTGGTGGSASGGTSNFSGGAGATGANPNSGGGGEAASSTSIGSAAVSNIGGTGNPGADGGAGVTSKNGSGSNGTAPGGGAGAGSGTGSGGNGGTGQIIIMYTTPSVVSNAGPDQNFCGSTSATLAGNSAAGYTGVWTCVSNCGGVTITTPSSATSGVTGLTLNTATTFQWQLTQTATGCVLSGDQVIITPASVCAPANDNPTGATPVTIGATCSYTTFTNANATASTCGTIPAPGCSSYTGGDVWFSVTVPASGGFIVDSQTGVMTDGGLAVYSGVPCGVMTLIGCDDDASANGLMPMLTVSGQTPGATLYIRFWEYGNNNNGTFGLCLTNIPTPPANDNPCSATAAPVNATATCTVQTAGTVAGATASGNALGACFGTADDDVWYSFVANNSVQNISLNNVSGSVTDMYFSVYSGACGALSAALLCSDPESNTVTGLTVGATYYIRIYTYTSITGQNSTFSLCISPPPPPPPNDNPCSATAAPVNATATCTVQTGGTVAGATSSTVGIGACGGTADDDVWYSFVANNTTQNISLNNLGGSTTDLYFSVYSGLCGSIGAALLCSDPESATITGLTVGSTYFIRVYSWTSTTGQTSTFSLCISPPPPPPPNDDPCSATPVTVNSAFTCTTQTGGTVAGASASGNAMGACGGTADDDVWFSFVANNSTQYINLNNLAGSTTDMYFSVYSGTCGSLSAALLCSDPESNIITGLTVGTTYYIRVYSWTSTTGQTSTFSLCITPPPPVPTNDNPCGATPAGVNTAAGTCTVQTAGTIAGATASGNAMGACGGTADDDVWFSFVANSTSMNINLNNVSGSTTDLYHSVYSGACGSLGTAIICSDPNSSIITGLTVGSTYYIRIYSYTSTGNQTTSFSLCINPTPPPPTNVTCNQMQPICSGSPIVFQAQSSGGSAAPGPNYGCLISQPNPTWFFMEILNPGTMAIDLTAGSDVDFALWGPYANLTAAQAACGTYPSPLDCSFSPTNIEQMNIASVTTGQVYAVLVTNYANVVQSITLNQASGATATTNCSLILPIELLYFNGYLNENKEVLLDWATQTERNNDYFEIEKSADGKNWQLLGIVDGKGNSDVKNNYNLTDHNPFNDISYYKLKQVDFDGSNKYTKVISIDVRETKNYITNLHPNPTKDILSFDIISFNKVGVNIELISFTGTVISFENKSIEKGSNVNYMNLNELENGVYLLKITFENTGETLTQKIIKD